MSVSLVDFLIGLPLGLLLVVYMKYTFMLLLPLTLSDAPETTSETVSAAFRNAPKALLLSPVFAYAVYKADVHL